MPNLTNFREEIRDALRACAELQAKEGCKQVLNTLGYSSPKTIQMDGSVTSFLSQVDPEGTLSSPNSKARIDEWTSAEFIFQLTNDELPMLAQGQQHLFQSESSYHRSIIESFVFLSITLEDKEWSRGALAEITRAINRLFPMPAILFFRYGERLTLSVIPRRPHRRDNAKDVVEPTQKISLIKDVDLRNPHRAHVDIIAGLHIHAGIAKKAPTNFAELYAAWTAVLSIEELNKRFYKELSDWYLWSVGHVEFPSARAAKSADRAIVRNQVSVIRLLTRLIFIWFIKEKGLVPEALFDTSGLSVLLKKPPHECLEESSYYLAILQNLFFATLNTQMGESRTWRSEKAKSGRTPDYLVSSLYRHKKLFVAPDEALALFRKIPFLNGGLFECLDREVSLEEIDRNNDLEDQIIKEGQQLVIRGDGFSEREASQPTVPNEIFFGRGIPAPELNKEFGTKGKRYEVNGLLHILERYKFTVEENTPFEEEVALDPELLGKVFENLIASYNEDTKTSARKLSGSFYTPRVVVDFMVDQALTGYLTSQLEGLSDHKGKGLTKHRNINQSLDLGPAPGELPMAHGGASGEPSKNRSTTLSDHIRLLLDYSDENEPEFSETEIKGIVEAIERLRAIDPACGSGAFLMGMLQKLVYVLKRLDPDNERWLSSIRAPLERSLSEARQQPDPARMAESVEQAEAELEKLDNDFSNINYPDFSRKLYLIDKCIHGVDIQPIAVQIAKLRFFISLVVSQRINPSADNFNITPLPNLETRLVAANALIPIQKPTKGELFRNEEIEKTEAELRHANERYFGTRTRASKRRARAQIHELRERLSGLLEDTQDLPEEEAKRIARWDPFDQNASADFFDPEWMFGLDQNFHIVIANPPYIRQEKINAQEKAWLKAANDLLKKGKGRNEQFLPLGLYQSFTGTADYLVYFLERGIDLLAPGGELVFITSNKWYRSAYGKNIRQWITRATEIQSIIDFGDAAVFDAIAYPTILTAKKRPTPVSQPSNDDVFWAWNWPADLTKKDIDHFRELFDQQAFQIPQKSLDSENGWQLDSQLNRSLLEHLRKGSVPLGDFVGGKIYYGIKTGLNSAFVISGAEKDKLVAQDPKSAEIIKPFLRGKDIKRWNVEPKDQWLIFTRRGIDIDRYPAIRKHLAAYKDQLTPKPIDWPTNKSWSGRKAGPYEWYEIQDVIAYWEKFEETKIFVPAIQNKVDYAVDSEGYYGNDKTNIIISENWAFILGVLNSHVSWWITQKTFSSKQGGFYEFKPMYLETLPIPHASAKENAYVSVIVKMILAQPKAPREEQLMNGLVYELYFKDELHKQGIHLFGAVDSAGIEELAALDAARFDAAAKKFIDTVFKPSHEVYRMLFELGSVEVVRLIEGRP